MLATPGRPQGAQTAAAHSTPQPAPGVILFSDIPERMQQTAARVRVARAHAEPMPFAREIERELPGFAQSARSLLATSRTLLAAGSSRDLIRELQSAWAFLRRQLDTWQAPLKRRSADLQNDLLALRADAKLWSDTRAGASAQQLPPQIVKEIENLERSIDEVLKPLLERRNAILKLQGTIGELSVELDLFDEEMKSAEGAARGKLLQFDGPPIWTTAGSGDDHDRELARALVKSKSAIVVVWFYLVSVAVVVATQAAAFTLALAIVLVIRRRKSEWPENEESRGVRAAVERPYSAALLVSLLAGTFWHASAPAFLHELAWLILLAPTLRLLARIQPRLTPAVWIVAILSGVDLVASVSPRYSIPARLLVLLGASFAAAGLVGVAFRWRAAASGWPHRLGRACLWLGAGLLCVAAFAEVAGATGLSRYLYAGAVRCMQGAAALYCLYRVVRSAICLALRKYGAAGPAGDHLAAEPPARLANVLRGLGGVLLGVVAIRAFGYSGLLSGWLQSLFQRRFAMGAIEFTFAAVVAFVAMVVASVLLSRVLRFVLSARLYRRLEVTRGTGEAVSKLLHYAVLTAGFLLALVAAGIDLNKFAVLAGGLSVGLGFGMQNIVNNFVSGLILLFERPLHVGDRITVGNLSGDVKDIGIRASTIRTLDGGDVVIPNASLITGEFTNWTLSDRRRRGQLRVGVAYGTDPELVIAILKRTAGDQPEILTDPAPEAMFTGFGDSSLDFALNYWTQLDGYFAVGSRLHVAVSAALGRAGIEIPFPQREISIRKPAPEAAGSVPDNAQIG